MSLIVILSSLYFVAILVMLVAARHAPEGYEDEGGFHLVWANNDPDIENVACVWGEGGSSWSHAT